MNVDMMCRRFVVALVLLISVCLPVFSRQADPTVLTLERLFSSTEFATQTLGETLWIDGGSGYTRLEPSTSVKNGRDIIRYDSESGRRDILVAAERFVPRGGAAALDIDSYTWSTDGKLLLIFANTKRVWRVNTRGDYWVLDLATQKLTKLGGDAAASTLMFAKFSPDGTRVGYVRQNNIYVENLADNRITRLTHDGSRTIINGTFDWVYEEELDLRDGWRWSPDGKNIAYWQMDSAGVREFYLIDNTTSSYPILTPIPYPKTGETNSASRIGVVGAQAGSTKWLDVPGDPRNHYIARMNWAASPDQIVLQQLNRLQNTNLVMLGDVRTGKVKTILTDHDDAWVDIHGDDIEWLEGGKRFVWVSERDGWRHAYVASRDGAAIRLITPGEFDVISVASIDQPGGWLYYYASPENATQRYLYRAALDGRGKLERVTPANEPGTHVYEISPNGRFAFQTYSSFGRPPRTDLVRLPGHMKLRPVVDNAVLAEKVNKLKRGPTEFFRVDIGGGVQLDAWMIKPFDFDPAKRYPVLFHVYGEPAGQRVLDRWFGENSLWHLLLSQRGYIVVSVDNRGTPSPRGRAWRKIIYRQIGILASQEQAAAAKAITRWPFVDPARIGIWGWSGGGSMTLNMMFRYPEIYKTGMSVAPVANQRYYDTIYQERYMGLPQDNVEGYKLGSPITYADRLQGNLLVVHGSGDDNVHYQNTEVLINALIAANKPFTMMEYPNRTHAISEGANTSRHLFELLTRYLEQNLLAGPR
ncbi:MAG: S9 family peptidase [Blastocatellia bacterium]